MRCRFASVGLALLTLTASSGFARTHHSSGKAASASAAKPVVMSAQPGTILDQVARQVNETDLAEAAKHHDTPVVLVASAPLSSNRNDMALFVQLQSARLCGSAGCSTSVYLRHNGGWKLVLDSVSGAISVLPARHNGMHDLLIDKSDRWRWNGSSYQDSALTPAAPAPQKKTPDEPKKNLLHG
ncbi:hypothetical protein [Asaia astilbis]|uniref:hypothetical protein n=1 Tax=Asaia astilbis TaxID=610244 RepID=UPI0005636AC2|nr:hypothetical protein [Asaia astilbis]